MSVALFITVCQCYQLRNILHPVFIPLTSPHKRRLNFPWLEPNTCHIYVYFQLIGLIIYLALSFTTSLKKYHTYLRFTMTWSGFICTLPLWRRISQFFSCIVIKITQYLLLKPSLLQFHITDSTYGHLAISTRVT